MNLSIPTNLLKCCKQCNLPLVVVKTGAGRGGSNSLRRMFCNNKCKNIYNKFKTENKIDIVCEGCNQQFTRYPSEIGRFCSYICKNNSQVVMVSRNCQHCGKEFAAKPTRLNTLFCSRTCHHAAHRSIRSCITCGKPFTVKAASTKVRCSRDCKFHDQSNGKIKGYLNGRSGWRKDIGNHLYFKSSLEADFARVMIWFGISFEYESKTFNLNGQHYTPDFYLPDSNMYVELKGIVNESTYSKLMTKNLRHHKELIDLGLNLVVIEQSQFKTLLNDASLWKTVPNLEQRNYKKTKELVVKHHENQTNSEHHF